MNDEQIKKGIKEIRKIQMTAQEKKQVFENIINSPLPSSSSVQSPWSFYIFMKRSNFAFYVIIPLLIVLTSGGIVFASEESLPTSILYPIKVSVVEPVRGALTFSKEAKAHYESDLATKRLIEAEELATEGKLDSDKEQQINTLLEAHSKKLDEAIDKIDKTDSSEQIDEIVTNFQAKMNAHAKVLDIITTERENKKVEERLPEDTTLQAPVEDQNTDAQTPIDNKSDNRETPSDDQNLDTELNAPMMMKININPEPEVKETQISKSARMNAEKISSKFKNNNDEEEINKDTTENKNNVKVNNYNKRKESIKSLINTTRNELEDATTTPSEDSKIEIIDNTDQTLNQAQDLLDDADIKKESGDLNNAYKSLIDSESSAKEANIFLKESLKQRINKR